MYHYKEHKSLVTVIEVPSVTSIVKKKGETSDLNHQWTLILWINKFSGKISERISANK